jgi:hypothetical protein
MQKLNFDLGLREYEVGGGVLRFNPSDPNVYARFVEAGHKLIEIEQRLVDKAKTANPEAAGQSALKLMAEADQEIKDMLSWIFGSHNNFDVIFCGTNVLSVGANGERVITNFIHAIQPIMESGAKKCAKQQIGNAAAKAQMNRAQRRATAKKK